MICPGGSSSDRERAVCGMWHRRTTRPSGGSDRPGTSRLRNVASQNDPSRQVTWLGREACGIGIASPPGPDIGLWRSKLLAEFASQDNSSPQKLYLLIGTK